MQQKTSLHFNLLGEMRVDRGGTRLRLPPSKKTRALLAYLLLSPRPHRREKLCGLFWDVADDPRGALRWSLSKLRGLVDDPERPRVVANRESVELRLEGAVVDVLSMRQALAGDKLEHASDAELERWAGAFAGELMEGLDLPDFHDFQAFCVAEREQARKLHAQILQALSTRLRDAPERALPHARAWARVDPLNLQARQVLLQLAAGTARWEEAEQHYASARRMFEELGSRDAPLLVETWQRLRARPLGAHKPAEAPPPPRAPAAREPAAQRQSVPEPATGHALVGRDRELERLGEALQRTRSAPREHVFLLSGEPGIGKSRLLEELMATARRRGATLLAGAAFEGESGRPYGPFIDGLRALSQSATQPLGAALAPLLPELGASAGLEGSRDRLFAAVSDFIASRAAEAPPVLLVLDDVQWLDPASAELLHYIARTSRSHPLMVVLAVRSEEASDNAALARVLRSLRRDRLLDEIVLSPLPQEALAELVADLATDDSTQELIAQSGGNPLFALELARVGVQQGAPLPDSVGSAVRERIERLGAQAADVLRWGAVLGDGLSVERLEELIALPSDQLLDALELLETHSLLSRSAATDGAEHYRFAHEIVRRVVYADLSEPRRRLMHRRAASTLSARKEQDEALVVDIAHHATLGHDHDLAASACARVGLRCQHLFANDQALSLARRGLRHAQNLKGLDRVKRTIELLEVQLLASASQDSEAMTRELKQLGEEALNGGATSHARLAFHLLSYIHWEDGAWFDAKQEMLKAESVSRRTDDPTQQVHSMAEAARCLILLERDLKTADAMLMEAEARARPLGVEPASLLDGRGMLLAHRGEAEEALNQFERAHRIASTERDRLLEYATFEHRVMVEIDRENYAGALPITASMIDLADRLREGSEAPFAHTVVALARYGLGEDCLDDLSAGLQSLRMADAKHRLCYALIHAALIDLQRAAPQRALARAQEALPIGRLLERPSETLLALLVEAGAAETLGDHGARAQACAAIAEDKWQTAARAVLKRRQELLDRLALAKHS